MERILPVAVALLALLGPALMPAAQAGYVEENSFRFVQMDRDQSAFAADFHPNETNPRARALIAGGVYQQGQYQRAERFLASYDGHDWHYLFNDQHRDGPWVDVEWKPDGEYALILGAGNQWRGSVVACADPCNQTGDLLELWREEVTPYAQQGFVGRQVDWHPSGDYALLAGGGLMRMNETFFFEHVNLGHETFFNALDWHPDGNWSLVQKDLNGFAICQDPCKSNGTHLTDYSNQICYGMYPDQEDCVDATEGTSRVNEDPNGNDTYPGSKSIEQIKFGPEGEKIYVSGVIHQRSRIMVITHHGSQDPADWTWRYLEPQGSDHDETKYGEVTSVDFHPDQPQEMLVGSTLDRQAMIWNASTDSFTTLLDLPQPKMQDTVWHPSGAYALFPSRAGFYRYDPYGMPTTNITAPAEGGFHADGPVEIGGESYPKDDDMDISAVETRVDRGPWSKIGEANWTRSDDGTVHWNATVDPIVAGAGHHAIYARAMDPVIVGAPSALQVCVGIADDDTPDDEQLPSVAIEDWNETAETVTVTWSDLTRDPGYLDSEVRHVVKRHPVDDPTDTTTWDVESGHNVTVNQTRDQGKMIYQVKTYTCGQELPYSGQASINLSSPPERPSNDGSAGTGGDGGDGSGDSGEDSSTQEPDAGGAPTNPWETPPEGDDGASGDDSEADGGSDDGSAVTQGTEGGSFIPGPQLPAALAAAAAALLVRRRRD